MRYVGLDGLRGVAALTVLTFHVAPESGMVGYLSVDLFFIISGFVLGCTYERRILTGLTAWEFAKIRLRRLGPVHLVGTAVGAIAAATVLWPDPPPGASAVIGYTALSATLVPMFWGAGVAFPLNRVQWSLWAEAVVNALYWATARWLSQRLLVAVIVAGWCASIAIALYSPYGWCFGFTRADIGLSLVRAVPAFACGVLIYRLHGAGRLSWVPRIGPLHLMLAWLTMAAIPGNIIYCAAVVIVGAPVLVVTATVAGEDSSRLPVVLGALSYPLYAVHLPIVRAAPRLFGLLHIGSDAAAHILQLLLIAGAVAAAYATMRLTERRVITN